MHRSNIKFEMEEGYAFQSTGHFNLFMDLVRERIERHLVWNKNMDPSSFISAFNHLCKSSWLPFMALYLIDADWAKRRANFHYEESQRIGHRVSIAEISTKSLVAASVSGRMRTTVEVTTTTKLLGTRINTTTKQSAIKIRDITIPVWIRDTARPDDWSSITETQRIASGADMWLSITEIRRSDLKKHTPKTRKCDTVAAKGHDYEWLACGFIPNSAIVRVMPWDGIKLHMTQDARIVYSIGSPDPWIFDWKTWMWRLDARLYRTACFLSVYGSNKRKREGEDKEDQPPHGKRKKKVPKLTKKQQAMLDVNPYVQGASSETAAAAMCCSACGQEKIAFRLQDEMTGPLAHLDLASLEKTPMRPVVWE